MRLFAYKMTHDTGFAPNPFWGYLTLATCKPKIREHKRPGDWVAGFTSKELCGDWVGDERLVFLMQVEERMALADYFHDRRFQQRIPRDPPAVKVYRCGDNIYRPLVRNARDATEFEQLPNDHHGLDHKDHNIKGRHALIARRSPTSASRHCGSLGTFVLTCRPGNPRTARKRVIWREPSASSATSSASATLL